MIARKKQMFPHKFRFDYTKSLRVEHSLVERCVVLVQIHSDDENTLTLKKKLFLGSSTVHFFVLCQSEQPEDEMPQWFCAMNVYHILACLYLEQGQVTHFEISSNTRILLPLPSAKKWVWSQHRRWTVFSRRLRVPKKCWLKVIYNFSCTTSWMPRRART